MTDKEKIRAEIERRIGLLRKLKKNGFTDGSIDAYEGILILIDSLPEENGRTLFEEIAMMPKIPQIPWSELNPPPKIPEMKKDEELEEAIDAEIVKDFHNLLYVKSGPLPMPSEHKFGGKVKIIILPNE